MKTIKIIAAALAAMTMVMSCQSQGNAELKDMLPKSSEIDSVSYLVGVQLGSFLKGQLAVKDASELNFAEVKKGMNDIIKNEDPKGYNDTTFAKQFKISPYEMNRIFSTFLKKKSDYKAEVNRVKGEKFLSANALKSNVGTTASGLQYTILAEGAAEKVAKNDTVTIKYKGTLIDGTVFDEGEIPGYVSGSRGLITGFEEGLCLVGEGGKAIIYLPSDLAYGSRGSRGIEPNTVLIFDIEIVEVKKFVEAEE